MSTAEIVVIDDFLDNPDAIRELALQQSFVKMHCAGLRTKQQFRHVAAYRTEFERILDRRLTHWDDNDANGRFQCCFKTDAIPYHIDGQSMAGILFLTPNAPIDAGLSLFRGLETGLRRRTDDHHLVAVLNSTVVGGKKLIELEIFIIVLFYSMRRSLMALVHILVQISKMAGCSKIFFSTMLEMIQFKALFPTNSYLSRSDSFVYYFHSISDKLTKSQLFNQTEIA